MLEALKLEQITLEDKFIIMEELWESMYKDAKSQQFTPQWHLDVLDSREKKIQNKELSFSDISVVKERLKQIKYDN